MSAHLLQTNGSFAENVLSLQMFQLSMRYSAGMPNLEAIIFLADESVLATMLAF